MTFARRRALAFAILAFVGLAAIAIAITIAPKRRESSLLPRRPSAARPPLLFLTSLPLLFSDQFSLEGGSPAVKRLESRYRLVPISVTEPKELANGGLLLMAHPLAQPAEDLVALDEWVRNGGRVLLLADPALEWPSKRPLGDPLRPAPMFMDTGLLAHWGLRLDGPDKRGPALRELGGFEVMTVSPGALSGTCSISADRLVARCNIGRGKAIVVADADFLNANGLGPRAEHNLDGVVAELTRLEQ